MLEKMLIEMCEKFPFEYREKDKKGAYTLVVSDIPIKMLPLEPGVAFYSPICSVPKNETLEDPEAFYVFIAQANYLGQGTGGHILSIDEAGKQLLLESRYKREISLPIFELAVERFANYLEFWREKMKEFEQKSQSI